MKLSHSCPIFSEAVLSSHSLWQLASVKIEVFFVVGRLAVEKFWDRVPPLDELYHL